MHLPLSAIVIRGPISFRSLNDQMESNGQSKWQFMANILRTDRDMTIKLCSILLIVTILRGLRGQELAPVITLPVQISIEFPEK